MLKFVLLFCLLLGLISLVFQMGCQHGRWSERRRQSMRHRLARADQERWGITMIHSFVTKPRKIR